MAGQIPVTHWIRDFELNLPLHACFHYNDLSTYAYSSSAARRKRTNSAGLTRVIPREKFPIAGCSAQQPVRCGSTPILPSLPMLKRPSAPWTGLVSPSLLGG